jgi:hypothetical protein
MKKSQLTQLIREELKGVLNKTKLQEGEGSWQWAEDMNKRVFDKFYGDIEYNAKFMQEETIKTLEEAIKLLQKAQMLESKASGISFTPRPIKLR